MDENFSLPHKLGSEYTLEHIIGQGATGTVYLGSHNTTSEPIAAKILHPQHTKNPDILALFVQEKQILTGLKHPNITPVQDMIVEGNTLAIISQYVDGPSLTQLLSTLTTLTPTLATQLTIQILGALEHIHQQNIVHRDIKPENILLTSDWQTNPTTSLRLTDFGISTILGTSTGFTGTPTYMAPELFAGKPPTAASDVYSTAITYYELLAGTPPFTTSDDMSDNTPEALAHLANLHASANPPSLRLPDELTKIMNDMLAKRPHKRPTTTEAIAALQELLPILENHPPLPLQRNNRNYTKISGTPTIVRPHTIVSGEKPTIQKKEETVDGTNKTKDPDKAEPQEIVPPTPLLPRTPAGQNATILQSRQVPEKKEIALSSAEDSKFLDKFKSTRAKIILASSISLAFALTIGSLLFYSYYTKNTTYKNPLEASYAQETPLPSGLTTDYEATWDPETKTTTLTITYTAQGTSLGGPFLETIQPLDTTDTCPTPQNWTITGSSQQQLTSPQPNNPSLTNISVPCAWAVETPIISPKSPLTIQTTIPMDITKNQVKSDENPLQTWLDTNIEKTTQSLNNPDLHTVDYPAQRIQGISVKAAPEQAPPNTTIHLDIFPVWPNGEDVTPIYHSPQTGPYTSTLQAITGNSTNPIHLYHSCEGAITITKTNTVTTNYPADSCQISATIGNLPAQDSNQITITGNDS